MPIPDLPPRRHEAIRASLLAALACALGCGAGLAADAQESGDLSSSSTPPAGEYCPSGSFFDGANCFFTSAPAGTQPFIYQGGFYYTPHPAASRCTAPATFDGANCFLRPVPSGYQPFLYQGSFYVQPNRHLFAQSMACPAGLSYDGANCLFGSPPAGHSASIHSGYFTFGRHDLEACRKILPGSHEVDLIYCSAGQVPAGVTAFIYQNRWYTSTTGAAPFRWMEKDHLGDAASAARLDCRADDPHQRWQLAWSDEFDDRPDDARCSTSDDLLQCVHEAWWGFSACADAPTDWTIAGQKKWTAAQKARYGGVVNLDKCRWIVYDQFNQWDSSNPARERTNAFSPKNIRIEGGILTMVTSAEPEPATGWDCGRQLNPDPATQGNLYSKDCPYAGATISSDSGLPWTKGNSPSSADPAHRYVGMNPGPGPMRVEFRVNVVKAGHGMWPAVWLFSDQNADPATNGAGELDALEFMGDMDGATDQFSRQSDSYGMAWQTVHNWGVDSQGYPHVSQGVGIPVRIGEWHVYAVETAETEVRMYIDGCLRNRIVEGEVVQLADGTTQPFHIPKDQTYSIIIGNPASAASWLPTWYQAWGGGNMNGRPDFQPTEIQVDYVRYYTPASSNGSGSR